MDGISYKPSPTALRFHQDTVSRVKFIRGPVGAGKTTIALMETFFISQRQRADAQGRRRTRWVIVRNTYGELKSTVIKTFQEWLGPLTKVVYDTPIRATVNQLLEDGTTLYIEYLFLALDSDDVVSKLRSLEATGFLFSKASEIGEGVIEMASSRINRYPKKTDDPLSGPSWTGMLMESNPPPLQHWIYRTFEIDRPKGYAMYVQPSPVVWSETGGEEGLGGYVQSPDAENLQYIEGGVDYYMNILRTARPAFIDVFVLGKYGVMFSGKPCWPRFNYAGHAFSGVPTLSGNSRLEPVAGIPLIIGVDPGLSGALVVTQMTPHGGIHVFDEIIFEDDILQDVIVERLKPLLAHRYSNFRVQVVTDPWGKARSALSSATTIDMFKQAGLAAIPAVTNDIDPRLDAVNFFLTRTGGFLVDPSGCPMLVEAMAGGYRFKKRRESDINSIYKDTPEKDKFSGPADALQYAALFHQRGQSRKGPRPPSTAKKFLYA